MGTYGQDWSSFQSSDLPTAGLGFVVVKQTEGLTYTNPNAAAQVAHARANGLVVGHYHYPHMANSPAAEADRFLTVARPVGGDFLVLDWEGYDNANKGVPFSTQVAYKKAWLAHVQAALPTFQTGTYANTDYLNRDPAGTYGDFLWIATANSPAGQPGITHRWLFHQYGASGIDRDYCPLTLADLKAWTHAKEPQENDVQLTDKITAHRGAWTDTDQTATVGDWIALGNLKAGKAADAAAKALAGVTAANAAIATLAAHLGKDVDTATVVAAVQKAIADAVVHVSVDVNGTKPSA